MRLPRFLPIAFLVLSPVAIAQTGVPWIQQAELSAGGYLLGGTSVAIDNSAAVVGGPGPWNGATGSSGFPGAAWVYVQNGDGTWTQQAELTASDAVHWDQFGWSVAISGTTIVVGADCHPCGGPKQLEGPGAAYVFVRNGDGTWSQQAELTASDGVAGDLFGDSVAISGSTVMVGAANHRIGSNTQQGAAYVFVQNGDGTWSQQAELTASDGVAGDGFGSAVALSGGTAIMSAPSHPFLSPNPGPGAAYVFVQNGNGSWSEQAELTAADGAAGDGFGYAVAVEGSTAVAGALFSSYERGAVYVFAEAGASWNQQAELAPSDGGAGFGGAVGLDGNTIVVGAGRQTVGKQGWQGSAYLFGGNGGTWTQETEVTSGDGEADDSFGSSVAVSGTTVLVGAPCHFHNGGCSEALGAAYVFTPGASTTSLSPSSLSFGNEPVNNISAAKTVTLQNTGLGSVDISNIIASADFAVSSMTCGTVLFVDKTCKVVVTFKPTQPGAATGTLSFTDDAFNIPQTVALSGTGTADATLTPAKATYAKQKVGMNSSTKTFTLTNAQPVALTSIAISITGDFAVSATTCGTSLAVKGKCTVSVTFTPQATGARTGQLIVSDSASNSPQTSNLSGTGD